MELFISIFFGIVTIAILFFLLVQYPYWIYRAYYPRHHRYRIFISSIEPNTYGVKKLDHDSFSFIPWEWYWQNDWSRSIIRPKKWNGEYNAETYIARQIAQRQEYLDDFYKERAQRKADGGVWYRKGKYRNVPPYLHIKE